MAQPPGRASALSHEPQEVAAATSITRARFSAQGRIGQLLKSIHQCGALLQRNQAIYEAYMNLLISLVPVLMSVT